jgi:hypothetical protein
MKYEVQRTKDKRRPMQNVELGTMNDEEAVRYQRSDVRTETRKSEPRAKSQIANESSPPPYPPPSRGRWFKFPYTLTGEE